MSFSSHAAYFSSTSQTWFLLLHFFIWQLQFLYKWRFLHSNIQRIYQIWCSVVNSEVKGQRSLTRAPQWAAISSNGAVWNFSTTCILLLLSSSSTLPLSSAGHHFKIKHLFFHKNKNADTSSSQIKLLHLFHSFLHLILQISFFAWVIFFRNICFANYLNIF